MGGLVRFSRLKFVPSWSLGPGLHRDDGVVGGCGGLFVGCEGSWVPACAGMTGWWEVAGGCLWGVEPLGPGLRRDDGVVPE